MRKRTAVTQSSRIPARLLALGLALMLQAAAPGVPAASERTITLGTDDGWRALRDEPGARLEAGRRGYLDLTLDRFRYEAGPTTELLLRFDETPLRDAAARHDVVGGAQELTTTAHRTGSGALLVDGPEDRIELVPRAGSAFVPGHQWADFTFEFWFYPVALNESGAILRWHAREGAEHGFRVQEVSIEIARGTTRARFENFFVRPDGQPISFELEGPRRLIPRTWAHHMVRFNGRTGLIEYLVDGVPSDLTHVSESRRHDGTVFYPRIAALRGDGLVVADGFVGAVDELRIESRFVEDPADHEYPPRGETFSTDYLDLGSPGARLTRIDAIYDAPLLSDVFLSYRLVDLRDDHSPREDREDWVPVIPGETVFGARGRFLQLRLELYPDTREGLSPRLSQIVIAYEPADPPLPPTGLRAIPHDGAVTLEWAETREPDIAGYLVYYGDQSGRYFGTDGSLGPSPVDVGRATSVTIDGLANGTLYFFAVQAYGSFEDHTSAEFSREVAARPAKVYR